MNALRTLMGMVAPLLCAFVWIGSASADEAPYPVRPIELYVGYPAGGSADLTARVLADAASKDLGQPIVIINKPGAGTVVELMALKNAKPDGYTIGTLATAGMINQYMRKVDYDTNTDFTPVIHYGGWIAGVVVRSDAPWKDFSEFLSYATANPGKIRFSTAGAGTQQHLTMVRLGNELGINWTHIPYKGGPAAVTAVMSGEVEATAQTAEWAPYVRDGKLRLLVTFGTNRTEEFPKAPALSEFGVKFDPPNSLGIVGPKGMSPKVVARLHDAFRKAMDDPNFQKALDSMSMLRIYKGPKEYAAFITGLNRSWGDVIRRALAQGG
jgi:tripartite-type tricarboxylate transporter receptor subunit TctC